MSLSETIETVKRDTRAAFETNSSFSRLMPKLQIAHDSSSIKAGKKCWRYYELSIVYGYTSPGSNDHLVFGTLLHSASEVYDHLRVGSFDDKWLAKILALGADEAIVREAQASGIDHERALLITVRYVVVATFGWTSIEPTKTKKTLLRTLIWYFDRNKDDTLKTVALRSGKAAVELSFRFNPNDMVEDDSFLAPTGEPYIFCGHLDKIVEFGGELWIVDKKTTKYDLGDQYFRQFTPDIQVSMYSVAGKVIFATEVSGFLIDGCQILVNGTRFRRMPISRSQDQLEEWVVNMRRYLRELEVCVREDYFPMNEEACGYGHMQCRFRQVCSADPAVRQQVLDSFYEKRVWDPLQPR